LLPRIRSGFIRFSLTRLLLIFLLGHIFRFGRDAFGLGVIGGTRLFFRSSRSFQWWQHLDCLNAGQNARNFSTRRGVAVSVRRIWPIRSVLRSRTVSIVLKLLALAFLIAAITLELYAFWADTLQDRRSWYIWFSPIWNLFLPLHLLVFYMPAVIFAYAGYRFGLDSADKLVAQDLSSPILYLRPFGWDGRHDFNPDNLGIASALL
jgi:hypothetical protein